MFVRTKLVSALEVVPDNATSLNSILLLRVFILIKNFLVHKNLQQAGEMDQRL